MWALKMLLYWALSVLSAIHFARAAGARQPPKQCEQLKLNAQPDVEILSVIGFKRLNVSTPGIAFMGMANQAGLNFCDVTILLKHPGANDRVYVKVWLPLEGWNGRFVGAGGGAFYGSLFDLEFGQAVARGYAVAGTEAGLFTNMTEDLNRGSWVLKEKGVINTDSLKNWVFRSVHDMAVVGKATIEAYYGEKPKFSYWYGCSTGGRQGYMEAQKFPQDFNGILAIAPSVNSPSLSTANMWAQIVMNQRNVFPLPCVYEKFVGEMVAVCDKVDGVEDGIISDPSNCVFDPSAVIGLNATCNGVPKTVTSEEAEVVRQILKGPVNTAGERMWYGLSVGTPFSGSANTDVKNGKTVGIPFPTAEAWIRYFLMKDPSYNPSGASFADMEKFMLQSNAEYGDIYEATNPNLSAFRQAGGKLLTWHGVADEVIPYEGTIHYRREMERKLGGAAAVDDFYRLFLAPGVEHCGGGAGPVPTDPLADLVAWVEHGKPPTTLKASTKNSKGALVTRNLCLYPGIWKYRGEGDPNTAESWTCTKNATCGPICGNLPIVVNTIKTGTN
jgi:hypothetical protein